MKINIGKPDRTRANIIQVSPSPGTLCYSLLFLHRPVIKRQMKKKLAHSPRAQATIIRRASTLPTVPPPLSSSFIVSPTPSSLSPTKIHTRVNWLNVVCVSGERSEINGNNFQWKKLRRINSFVFVLSIWRISIFKSLVYFFRERERERDESKTENRILEGNGAELNCQAEIIWTGIAGETVRAEASFRGGEKIRFKDPHLACSEQWIFQRWLYPPSFITLPYLSVSKVPITQPRVREREREKENASRLHDSFNPGNRISWTDWREGAKG